MKSNRQTPILRQRGIFKGHFPGQSDFVLKVRACQAEARRLFPGFRLSDEDLPIVFVKSGRIAGMAKNQRSIYNIEFSVEAILRDWEEMTRNTIPHEMAHIVDMYLHNGKSSHGPRWQSIIQALGGSPQRTHDIPLRKARRSRRYIYIASCGTEVEVGPRHHKSVSRGGTLIVKKTGGRVTKEDFTGKILMK